MNWTHRKAAKLPYFRIFRKRSANPSFYGKRFHGMISTLSRKEMHDEKESGSRKRREASLLAGTP